MRNGFIKKIYAFKRAGSDRIAAFVNRGMICWLAGMTDRCIRIMDYYDNRFHVFIMIIHYDYDCYVKSSLKMKHACPPGCILIHIVASLLSENRLISL